MSGEKKTLCVFFSFFFSERVSGLVMHLCTLRKQILKQLTFLDTSLCLPAFLQGATTFVASCLTTTPFQYGVYSQTI